MTFSRLARPFDAMLSLRGLTATDTFKVVMAMLVGYFAIFVSKVLKPVRASVERRFGATRLDFIIKLTNTKYVLLRSPEKLYFIIRYPYDGYWVVSPEWEPEVKHVFRPKQGEVVIDVGAHIGAYTISAARIVGKKGLVVALEPDPENFDLLSMNIKLNKLSNVIALRTAAYESDGTSIMHRSEGSGTHSLVRIPEKFIGEIKVPTVTLDTLVRRFNLDRVDWLKIDVEGAELCVLKGASSALEIVRNLIAEVWNENQNGVFGILKQRGYKITVLSEYVGGKYILAQRQVSTTQHVT
jgi:FkbM family methyltransferase